LVGVALPTEISIHSNGANVAKEIKTKKKCCKKFEKKGKSCKNCPEHVQEECAGKAEKKKKKK
jgi:hypothetical protein